MEISNIYSKIKSNPSYKEQIIFETKFVPKSPVYGTLDFSLSPPLEKWLKGKNLQLYSHQAKALNLIHQKKNIVITTPTASGKTLIFSLAVANAIAEKRRTTALFLYPMKALANDQLKKLKELDTVLEGRLRPFIYDGDTPSEKRPAIRNYAQTIISNPYALHQYLDWHPKWDRFFRNLRFLIIDEAHTYRGVFGSNVAQLLRRLFRILKQYNSSPQIILSSATINNPKEFTTKLIGKPVEVVADNGAAIGEKHFIMWNPPFLSNNDVVRRSPHQETRELLFEHVRQGFQTLCFTQSRRMAELLSRWIRQDLAADGVDPEQVMSYRAGYRPRERRTIEEKLRKREIQAVTSTNALEVGIDIGELDAVILSGFPGTIISLWQQIGRVGRNPDRSSLATLVLFSDAYQQFLGNHPKYLLERNPENAIIDLENPYILKGHLLCAAKEIPVHIEEIESIWGETGKRLFNELRQESLVNVSRRGITASSNQRPASIVHLNSAFTSSIEVLASGTLLETMTIPQAYREAHEGAILIHQGETYLIEKINWDLRKAFATKIEVDYYTETKSTSDVQILSVLKEAKFGFPLTYGEVRVTEVYHSYVKQTPLEVLETVPLDLPPLKFDTKALWFDIPDHIVNQIIESRGDLPGGIHALEHATIALSPMFAMCDRWDIGGVSYPKYPMDGHVKIFIYDGFPGGIGISEMLYAKIKTLLTCVKELIRDCSCNRGCPSCVQSPKCGNDNFPLDKAIALRLVKLLLDNL
ncbi:MAG: DEAD/DEAH box helicase [Candidatus Heimdallarchaeota archaeon]